MAILNPSHLFDQAERLSQAPPAGPPRQVDLRRAVSAAYYGVFHFTLAAVADEVAGVSRRGDSRYALIYRSIDHRTFKEVCIDIAKQTPPRKYAPYAPAGGFHPRLAEFAQLSVDLQEQRHSADYDPLQRFQMLDAVLAIASAKRAVRRLERAPEDHRKIFLTLLLCPPH